MDHADECLSFLLRLSGVWCEIKAEGRSLLHLLHLRISAMPTCSDRVTMLFLKFAPQTNYTKVTTASLDSQALVQQPRKAPPVGRVLRILLGLVLIAYVAPVYFQVPVRVATGSLVLVIGLIGVYSLIHIVVSRRIVAFGSCRSEEHTSELQSHSDLV